MKSLARFLYEIGHLKRVKRVGWWLVGVDQPESVAEHSFRVTIIGFILAKLEGADPMKTMALCLFHDTQEARIGDSHTLVSRYDNWKKVEMLARMEITENLPAQISEDIKDFFDESQMRETLESKIARDADLLECLIQAREYQVKGYVDVQDFIKNNRAALITESAKKIADECMVTEPKEWWQKLDMGRKES